MEHQKHEFDLLARNYQQVLDEAVKVSGENGDFFAQYKAQKLGEWLTPRVVHSLSILDFGCGTGHMTRYVQQVFKNARIWGVDPSADSIDVARTICPEGRFEVSGATIPSADQQFDVVFAAGAFHHIPFEEHANYVREVFRVLKPGGVFAMFELNPRNPVTVKIFNNNPIDQNATMLTTTYAHALLGKQGAVDLKYYGFFPRALASLRPCEKYLTWVPWGALYCMLVTKPSAQQS